MTMQFLSHYCSSHFLHPGASIVRDAPLTISTPAAQWAYALSCRLGPHLLDHGGALAHDLRFVFDVTVGHGRIGVGWTNPGDTSFLSERLPSRRDSRIAFLLQAGARVGHLVFRNVDSSGNPSEFTIAHARVEHLPAGETRHPARPGGALVQQVLERDLWATRPFFLLDVGCSGGLAPRWSAFGSRLRAVGFDPLVAEVDRLTKLNDHPGIAYEATFVIGKEPAPLELSNDPVGARTNQSFQRTSAVAAARQMAMSYVQEVFNAGAPIVLTDRRVTLDDYVNPAEHADVDFLKVDTDGQDIDVIAGASDIMAAGGLLGLHVEVQFHGLLHDRANTFSNIDRLLRRSGFSLFDLDLRRYSRADLPATFVLDTPAQTVSGQVAWAEALYLRDLASEQYEDIWRYEITPERVIKLACLFDLFELPDCAAELLRTRGHFLRPSLLESLLDLLASGKPGAHAKLLARFEHDFTLFYPSEWEGWILKES